jgi:hypothetical protein
VKGAGCFGSAESWLKVCTAGDALDDWLSIRLHGGSMPEVRSGAVYEPRDVRLQLELLEVRDECSSGDLADGLGYGCSR